MYNLTLAKEHAYGPDTYVLDIHRLSAGVVSISTDQRLSLVSADLGVKLRALGTGGDVSCLGVVSAADGVVCTAGSNGTVSVWDLRATEGLVARFQASEAPIISLACDAASHSIAVGTELQGQNASIHIWDVRGSPAQRRVYTEVHSDDVTELKFHPTDPNILLSGSTDGLVNICDTRVEDEDEVILQTLNHGSSIHRAGFLGGSSDVFAVSHDERFAVYSVADEHREVGAPAADFGDVRGVLGCQYVAGVAAKMDGSGAIIGAGSQDQHMFSLVHLARNGSSWQLEGDNRVNLPGAHGEEIVRGFCVFDDDQVVYTCGEDGKIKAWYPGS